MQEPTVGAWTRSSYCDSSDNCVEVSYSAGEIFIRDSKNPAHAPLHFTLREWVSFLSGAVCGEFEVARLIESSTLAKGLLQPQLPGGGAR